jgi:Tfp pilus assembly major pilin PilA
MTKKNSKPRINRGMSLISMALVLGIVMVAAPVGMERYANYLDEQNWTVAATHLGTVNKGARQYIQDNYDALLNQVKGGGNVTVTGQTLRDKGYLPAGFALTNNSAQNYVLTVTRNPTQTDKLVAFVLTAGGQELPFKAQRYIAQNTSGLGGYLYPANVANGASGGWQVNLASMGLSGQTGHLVTYLTSDALAGGAEESDRLYRFAVNGRPDLNRMHTSVDMNGNNLNNAKAVNAETGTFSGTVTGNAVTSQGDVRSQGGWLITKSGKGWLNEDHGGGLYMDDNNWIKSVNGKGIYTSGQLRGGSVRADGRLSTGEVLQLDQINTAGTACSPNGLVSRDNTGEGLWCKNGVWTTGGSGFEMPKPQTINCTIVRRTSGYTYYDNFQARLDDRGAFWSRYLLDGQRDSGWVRGSIQENLMDNTYRLVTVSLAGLIAMEDTSSCSSGSGGSSNCVKYRPVCAANWVF